MKQTTAVIDSYSIRDMAADDDREMPGNDIYVFRSGDTHLNEKLLRHPVRSDHFKMALVVKGHVYIQYSMIDYVLPANSLFVISPGVVHKFEKPHYEDTIVLGIAFTRDFLGQTGMHMKHIEAFDFLSSQNSPDIQLDEKDADTIKSLILLIQKKSLLEEEHPYKTEVLNHGFMMFMFEMAAISRKYRENSNIKMTRREDILMGFIKLLSAHFKEERSVQYYADAMFITPKHLTKTVKEITNKTTGEIIDNMVINEAKILLDDLGLSVANVADQLHFSDQFFFSKFFKKHAGVNPSEYKTSM